MFVMPSWSRMKMPRNESCIRVATEHNMPPRASARKREFARRSTNGCKTSRSPCRTPCSRFSPSACCDPSAALPTFERRATGRVAGPEPPRGLTAQRAQCCGERSSIQSTMPRNQAVPGILVNAVHAKALLSDRWRRVLRSRRGASTRTNRASTRRVSRRRRRALRGGHAQRCQWRGIPRKRQVSTGGIRSCACACACLAKTHSQRACAGQIHRSRYQEIFAVRCAATGSAACVIQTERRIRTQSCKREACASDFVRHTASAGELAVQNFALQRGRVAEVLLQKAKRTHTAIATGPAPATASQALGAQDFTGAATPSVRYHGTS